MFVYSKHVFPLTPEQFLILQTGTELVEYRNPSKEWAAIEQILPIKPGLQPTAPSVLDRELIAHKIIYDTRQLKLQKERIEKFLSSRCAIPSKHRIKLVDVLGLMPLPELSEELAVLGQHHPEVVHLALSGKIASAVHAVPNRPFSVGSQDYSINKMLDLVADVAGYHLLIALRRAGEDAYRRCFEPTGLDVLDYQPGRMMPDGKRGQRPTTVKHAAGVISWNAEWIMPIIALYEASKQRSLTPEEEQLITNEPGLVEEGKRWEKELTRLFGQQTAAFVDRCNRLARVWSKYIHVEARREFKNAPANRTLYAARGENPLVNLWLACAQARGWTKPNRANQNLLKQAIKSIHKREVVVRAPVPEQSDPEARQIFFLIRNCVTRDPKSHAMRLGGRDRDVIAKIERAWQAEQAKRTLQPGAELFSVDLIDGAYKVYQSAEAANDTAFLAEVHGQIWRQLHL